MFKVKKGKKAGAGGSAPFKLTLLEATGPSSGGAGEGDSDQEEETEKLARLLGISTGKKKKKKKKKNSAKKRKGAPRDNSKESLSSEQQPKKQKTSGAPSTSDSAESASEAPRQESLESSGIYSSEYLRVSNTFKRQSMLTSSSLEPIGLARRKCFDNVMGEFLIGNTFARSLVSPEEAQKFTGSTFKFLWTGVGDLRNPLTTLSNLPSGDRAKNVQLFMNDISPVTFARNIALLALVVGSPGHDKSALNSFVAIWSDSLLEKSIFFALKRALRYLLGLKAFPPWLQVSPETWAVCVKHWKAWESKAERMKPKLVGARKAALKGNGGGHGRAGAVHGWNVHGVSSRLYSKSRDTYVNPTMYDFVTEGEIRYLECQGPAGSFSSLPDPKKNGEKFASSLFEAWRPLLASFQEYVKNGLLLCCFKIGDGLRIMRSAAKKGTKFHAIDSSNIMDYVGLWNLVLSARTSLAVEEPGWKSFLFTEQIMSLSTTIEEMLGSDLPPFDPSFNRSLSSFLGLNAASVPGSLQIDEREKVVHARWYKNRDSPSVQAVDLKAFDPSGVDANVCISLLDMMKDILDPRPMTAAMLEAVTNPLDQSYIWPTSTTGTFVEMIAAVCSSDKHRNKIAGLLDECFYQRKLSGDIPFIKNRTLALRVECSLRAERLEPALEVGQAYENNLLYKGVQRTCLKNVKPLFDLFKPKGGIFEPALALCLVRNKTILEAIMEKTGKWERGVEADDEPVNILYEWFEDRGGFAVQFIDNIEIVRGDEKHGLTVIVNLPMEDSKPVVHQGKPQADTALPAPRHPPLLAFKYGILIDVQQCQIVSRPIKMRKYL